MCGEVVVIGCPTTMLVVVCGVVGGVNDVRTIAFADSCGALLVVIGALLGVLLGVIGL